MRRWILAAGWVLAVACAGWGSEPAPEPVVEPEGLAPPAAAAEAQEAEPEAAAEVPAGPVSEAVPRGPVRVVLGGATLTVGPEGKQVGVPLLGVTAPELNVVLNEMAAALRAHKANGGNWADFEPPRNPPPRPRPQRPAR